VILKKLRLKLKGDINSSTKESNKTNSINLENISECAVKKDDLSRLKCYDDFVKSLGIKNTTPTIKVHSKWIVTKDKSPIDDSDTVVLTLDSSEPIINNYQQLVTPTIILRCSRNTTNAYVTWDMFLGTDTIQVLSRIDKKRATTKTWYISTDYKATFAPKNISFIKSLFGHKKLVLQLTPYGSSTKTTSFDISGIEEQIKPLRKACKW